MPAKLSGTTLLALLCTALNAFADDSKRTAWHTVSGSGTHFFSTAIVHSVEDTATGVIQRSTDTVELEGDLSGRVLFQPISHIDPANGTLVNTGHQVFSGSVLGSKPVLLHDDDFRFDVDLNTGATTGEIFLVERIAGPRTRCLVSMTGTSVTPAGDNEFVYEGRCQIKGSVEND
ncbi:MAG: hypothetical protein OES38_05410 [Gammaproteobacteria bacterium]|nr:hypothetical protein [Gammaproteobacteria bacterium]